MAKLLAFALKEQAKQKGLNLQGLEDYQIFRLMCLTPDIEHIDVDKVNKKIYPTPQEGDHVQIELLGNEYQQNLKIRRTGKRNRYIPAEDYDSTRNYSHYAGNVNRKKDSDVEVVVTLDDDYELISEDYDNRL